GEVSFWLASAPRARVRVRWRPGFKRIAAACSGADGSLLSPVDGTQDNATRYTRPRNALRNRKRDATRTSPWRKISHSVFQARRSVCPVLYQQAGHLLEVLEVARDDRGAAGQVDAGYQQVATSDLLGLLVQQQLVELRRGASVHGNEAEVL